MQRKARNGAGAFAMNGLFMTGVLRVKYLLLLGCSLVVASPAVAQDTVGGEDEARICAGTCMTTVPLDTTITVLASGQSERVDLSGQSISVIGLDEIKQVQGPDLSRVLERLPGVSLARSGPLGSQTSLFVRGAPSEQVVVMIDGVRMQDQAAPSGGFDFGTLLTGGIGKIELLRGSNSVAWGSDAMGGVLAVTSREFDGLDAGLEYGANDSVSANATLGKTGSGYGLTASGGYVSTDGISAFAPGTERDGFRQWQGALRGRADLADGLKFTATARYADSRVDFDGFPPPTYAFADTLEYQTTRQASGRTGLEYDSDGFSLRGGVALSDTRRSYFDRSFGPASSFDTVGRSWRVDVAGKIDAGDRLALLFGGDSEWTRFSTTFDSEKTARLSSGFAMIQFQPGPLSLAAGVRLTDHDRYGSNWTFGANGTVRLGDAWRIKASFGEGFKAPTLSQLYGYGGNAGLKPETSTAFDFGIEHGSRSRGLYFAATAYRRDSSNLIDYVSPTGYFNIGRTRAQGFELEGGAQVDENLRVGAVYSYLDAVNRNTGTELARRPRHALTSSIDWRTPLAGLKLGADLRLVGDSFDDAGNLTRLDGYALVTLRASVPLGDKLELYGRVENLTDESYQTVAGYGTYGRSAYAGVRVKW